MPIQMLNNQRKQSTVSTLTFQQEFELKKQEIIRQKQVAKLISLNGPQTDGQKVAYQRIKKARQGKSEVHKAYNDSESEAEYESSIFESPLSQVGKDEEE
jgi:hypothetical protein